MIRAALLTTFAITVSVGGYCNLPVWTQMSLQEQLQLVGGSPLCGVCAEEPFGTGCNQQLQSCDMGGVTCTSENPMEICGSQVVYWKPKVPKLNPASGVVPYLNPNQQQHCRDRFYCVCELTGSGENATYSCEIDSTSLDEGTIDACALRSDDDCPNTGGGGTTPPVGDPGPSD